MWEGAPDAECVCVSVCLCVCVSVCLCVCVGVCAYLSIYLPIGRLTLSVRPAAWPSASEAAAAAPDGSNECGAVVYCSSSGGGAAAAAGDGEVGAATGGAESAGVAGLEDRCNPQQPPTPTQPGAGGGCFGVGGVAAGGAAGAAGESGGSREMRQLWVVTMRKRATQLDLSRQLLEALPTSMIHLGALRRLVLDDNLLQVCQTRLI
jgi:hypothetical protein